MPQAAIFIAARRGCYTRPARTGLLFSERVAWRALIGSSCGIFSIRFVLWALAFTPLSAGGRAVRCRVDGGSGNAAPVGEDAV